MTTDAQENPARNPLALRLDWKFCHTPRTMKLLRRFMAETAECCRAAEATFWVISSDGKRVEGAINSGKDKDEVEKLVVHANDSVVGLIATTGISACIGPGDFMNPEIKEKYGVRNMVVAPVMIDSEISGVVTAINVLEGDTFKPGDLETLQWKAYLLSLILADADKNDDLN
jgi:hypothetical protein